MSPTVSLPVDQPDRQPEASSFELGDVPFFPQSRYQCGPAALATVLGASGVPVSPEELVGQVYLPGRSGSLQIELKAAARRTGRIPVEIEPDIDTLFAEAAAGQPVLVLQNLAFSWWPRWHYAVVVGFDAERQQVLLRSGTTRRRVEGLERFLRSWSLGGNWGLVVLEPGQLPRADSPDSYLRAVLDSERALLPEALTAALDGAAERWPGHANLQFALANQQREQGDRAAAMDTYQRLLRLAPGHVGALNNSADLLLELGCAEAAGQLIKRAIAQLQNGSSDASPYARVIGATSQEIDAALAADDVRQSCQFLMPEL